MRWFSPKLAAMAVGTVFFWVGVSMAASVIDQGKWGVYRKGTKKEDTEIVKEKKPSSGVFRTTGIDKALKNVDKSYANGDEDKGSKKKFEALKKAKKKFKSDSKWKETERAMVLSQYKDLKTLFKKSAGYYKKRSAGI